MNCDRIQNLLSAYLDQELTPEERRMVRKHLFSCPSCSELYEELTLVKGSLGRLEPPEFCNNYLERLEKMVLFYYDGVSLTALNHTLFWGKRLLLTAACILLFLLTSLLLFPTPTSPNFAADSRPAHRMEEKGRQEPVSSNFYLPGIPVSR